MNAVDTVKAITIATPIAGALAVYGMVRSKAYRTYSGLLAILITGFVFELTFGSLRSISPPLKNRSDLRFLLGLLGDLSTVRHSSCIVTIRQVLQEVMAPLPGLARLATLIYGWVVIILIIVAVSSSFMPFETRAMIGWALQRQIERCVGIMELSLLTFRLGYRRQTRPLHRIAGGRHCDRPGNRFHRGVHGERSGVGHPQRALASQRHHAVRALARRLSLGDLFSESRLSTKGPVRTPPTSPLNRWNEVGLAFSATTSPCSRGAGGFLFVGCEQAVDRVLVKNATNTTES